MTGDERYAREFVAEVGDWIDRNPFAYGVNWACAMDVALRAVNWMWGFYFMGAAQACARSRASAEAFIRSLYMHGEFVSRNLETSDINGNHYLSDGGRPGLSWACCSAIRRMARAGSRLGERILSREIRSADLSRRR